MVTSSQKIRIHNTIIDYVAAQRFYAIQYDPETRHAELVDGVRIYPSEILTNEISTRFDLASDYGQRWRRQRAYWPWTLMVGFEQEVLLEFFEEAWAAQPIMLPADNANGLVSLRLECITVDYNHPAKQQTAGGSKILVTFDAIPQRA